MNIASGYYLTLAGVYQTMYQNLSFDFNEFTGGEVEIQILAEIKNVHISVVQLQTLGVLTYSPPNPQASKGRIYILYTGQHYDAIVAEGGDEKLFPNSEAGRIEVEAIKCAQAHKIAWDEQLRTRIRKKIKCTGCEAILDDSEAFQTHCLTVEHDDEFCYDCEEIQVTEQVDSPDED